MAKKMLINGAFYALVSIGAIVVSIILGAAKVADELSTALILGGLSMLLLSGFQFARILKEEGKLKVLRIILIVLGCVGILGAGLLAMSGFEAVDDWSSRIGASEFYSFIVGFSIIAALIFNCVARNFNKLFEGASEEACEFLSAYGFPMFFVFFLGLSFLLAYLVELPYVALFILNWVVMAVFVILNTRDKKILKVCSYLVLGVCFLCNLIFAIVYGTDSPANDGMSVGDLIKEQEAGAPYFNFAAMLFPFLTFVICIPFHIVDAVKDKFSQDFASAVYLIMPLLCFGLQFLMFFYWYVALIVMAVLFVLSFVVGIFWDPFKNAGGGGGGARGLQPGDVTPDRVERALRYSELEHWIESLSVTNGYTYGHVNVDLYVRESMGGGQGKYSASHIERILKSEIGSDVMKYVTINLYTTRR